MLRSSVVAPSPFLTGPSSLFNSSSTHYRHFLPTENDRPPVALPGSQYFSVLQLSLFLPSSTCFVFSSRHPASCTRPIAGRNRFSLRGGQFRLCDQTPFSPNASRVTRWAHMPFVWQGLPLVSFFAFSSPKRPRCLSGG